MNYREKVLAAARQARQIRPITVEGYDEPFYLRDMTGADRDAYEASLAKYRDKAGNLDVMGHSSLVMAEVVVRTLVDDKGAPVFTPDDVTVVHADFPRALLDELSTTALTINRSDAAGIKTAAKNS